MIPKVTGYSGFNSYGALPYSMLKPGQKQLDRDYYKDANRVKPDGKTYLSTFSRFGSNHQHCIDKTVKPSDYKVASRGGKQNVQYEYLHNPELFNYSKAGRLAATQTNFNSNNPRASTELRRAATNNLAGSNTAGDVGADSSNNLYKTTSHWKSLYQQESDKAKNRPSSQAQRPFWSYPKRQHVARRTFFKTEYQNTLGTYGHNPRKKLDREATKMENEVNELTMGSTKVSGHTPGYGGYMVKTDFNDKALLHGQAGSRELMKNKINLSDNFTLKIPGFSGYKPMSNTIDRTMDRPNLFSTKVQRRSL